MGVIGIILNVIGLPLGFVYVSLPNFAAGPAWHLCSRTPCYGLAWQAMPALAEQVHMYAAAGSDGLVCGMQETMGVLIGSAVVPIACCLLWRKTSRAPLACLQSSPLTGSLPCAHCYTDPTGCTCTITSCVHFEPSAVAPEAILHKRQPDLQCARWLF